MECGRQILVGVAAEHLDDRRAGFSVRLAGPRMGEESAPAAGRAIRNCP
jgi:hypothetical protein